MSTGEIIGGLAAILIAGVLNGSWNAAFSPKLGLAVALSEEEAEKEGFRKSIKFQTNLRRLSCKRNNEIDLDFHNAWLLFQIYAVLFNVPVCIIWAGGAKQVSYIVSQASSKTLCLVALFSVLWGVGSVVLGIACRIAGVGLGSNLFFVAVTILGTVLPLAMDGLVVTTFGLVIFIGIFVCCIGLYFSTVSLLLRDRDEASVAKKEKQLQSEANALEENNEESDIILDDHEGTNESKEISTFVKVAVCILGGALASMLQFAFVFGDELVKAAEESPQTPASGSAAVIWLFAFSLQFPVSFIHALMKSSQPLSAIWNCPWWRHVLVFMTTSIPWLSHIHIYGLATTLLPDKMAASVAWPVLMMSTLAQGMILSIILGEWKAAGKDARKNLKIGLTITFLGVVVLMASVAV